MDGSDHRAFFTSASLTHAGRIIQIVGDAVVARRGVGREPDAVIEPQRG